MKPKTKEEKKVVRYSHSMRKALSAKQLKFAKSMFDHLARTNQKGECLCEDCGHEWKQKGLIKGDKCPHCGTTLTLAPNRKKSRSIYLYMKIVTLCKEYQVIRYFQVWKNTTIEKCNTQTTYSYREVVQKWMSQSHFYIIALCRNMNWQWNDCWVSGPLELRKSTFNYNTYCYSYEINDAYVYPTLQFSPFLRQIDYHPQMDERNIDEQIRKMFYNKFETLWKLGHKELIDRFDTEHQLNKYWNSLKICFRHHYTPKDWNLWIDMMNMLAELNMDTHNPVYVCPKNLNELHDKLHNRIEKTREKERKRLAEIEAFRKMEEDKEAAENYIKTKQRFFSLLITDGTINLDVLKSVEEFMDEGKAMHHCVFNMGYYRKPESLILSAKKNGERVETVEVSLRDFDIVQSRAYCNGVSPYHDEIINLVNNHMEQIKSLAKVS